MGNNLDEEKRRQLAEAITKELSDQGRIVEGGWKAYELLILHDASDIQKKECRKAYFHGAQHLYASMITFLDPGPGETDQDMARMEKLHKELEKFVEDLKRGLN